MGETGHPPPVRKLGRRKDATEESLFSNQFYPLVYEKNILFMMTLLLSTLWAQAARDWNPPSGNQYPSHAVVYATLFDASGQEVDNVADMRVGAFIDGECRAAANPVFRETPDGGRYIYTLRIGVNDADKGKKVQFVLHDPSENDNDGHCTGCRSRDGDGQDHPACRKDDS